MRRRHLIRALVPLLLAMSSRGGLATAQNTEPGRLREVEKQPHLLIWDVAGAGAGLGIVAGIARGRCHGRSFNLAPVASVPLLANLLTLTMWGERHTLDTLYHQKAATSFDNLRRNGDWRGPIELLTHDGAWTQGTIVAVTPDSIVTQIASEHRVFAQSDVAKVDRVGDRWWDTSLFSLGAGALWGLAWHGCFQEDPVPRIPREPMMVWGAAIFAVAALAMDLLHEGRVAIYRSPMRVGSRSFRLSPVVWPSGVGFSVQRSLQRQASVTPQHAHTRRVTNP